jgi:hypothetical protein
MRELSRCEECEKCESCLECENARAVLNIKNARTVLNVKNARAVSIVKNARAVSLFRTNPDANHFCDDDDHLGVRSQSLAHSTKITYNHENPSNIYAPMMY